MTSRSSLISSIPFEIWTKIFKLSLPQNEQLTPYRTYKRAPAPVTVSHVCVTWRDIALATPQLWATIFLLVRDTQTFPNVELINLLLERSRSEPLSAHVLIFEHHMGKFPEIDECLITLFNTFARWKAADFYFDCERMDPISTHHLFSTIEAAPLLESIGLEVTEARNVELAAEILPHKFWIHSPILKNMAICVHGKTDNRYTSDHIRHRQTPQREKFPSWVLLHNIPFEQLTHLRLESDNVAQISWTDAYTVFTDAPNLITCFLVGIGGRPMPKDTKLVTLQYLRHLYLQAPDHGLQFLTGLDRILTAPSLVTIAFANGWTWDQESCTRFITRSSCPLEELHYINTEVPRDKLLAYMRLSPSLKAVYLGDTNYDILDGEFVRRMTEWDPTTNRFVLCPNLQKLSFSSDPERTTPKNMDNFTMNLLKMRLCPPNNSPRIFTTLGCYPMDKSVNNEWRILCGEPWGLKIIRNDDAHDSGMLWERCGGI